MIQRAILEYIDHLEDPAYLAALFAQSDIPRLEQGIISLLHNSDHDTVGRACLFIRDLILIAPRHGIGVAFRDAFGTSAIVAVLEQLVLSNNHFIRQHAIYTLGKTGSTASIPTLHQAFQFLRERDPILLPRLVGEILWLETQKNWALIEDMTASQQYTTRWAVLGSLDPFAHDATEDTELVGVKQRCFTHLRDDSHPLVRAEAEYAYQQLVYERKLSMLTKAERRKQRKELNRQKPVITFSDVEVRYSNHLYTSNIVDYAITDLEQFIINITPTKADAS